METSDKKEEEQEQKSQSVLKEVWDYVKIIFAEPFCLY